MVGALLGDAGVEVPEVDLPVHALHGRALLVPDRGDVEEGIGLPAHLLGLVGFEQIQLRRAEHLLTGVVAPGLRDHAGFERDLRGVHVVGVVGVVLGVAHHERGLHPADDVDQIVLVLAAELERVVAQIHAHQIVHAQRLGGVLGLLAAGVLDGLQVHALLLPQLGALSALAEGQAHDGDRVAKLGVQGDGPPQRQTKSGRVGADDQRGFGGSCGRRTHVSSPWSELSGTWKNSAAGTLVMASRRSKYSTSCSYSSGLEGAAHRLIAGADRRAVFFDNGAACLGQADENLALVGLALDQIDQALLAQVRQGAADQRAVGAEQLGQALHVLCAGLAQPQQNAEVHEAEVGDQREQLLGLRLDAIAEAGTGG